MCSAEWALGVPLAVPKSAYLRALKVDQETHGLSEVVKQKFPWSEHAAFAKFSHVLHVNIYIYQQEGKQRRKLLWRLELQFHSIRFQSNNSAIAD